MDSKKIYENFVQGHWYRNEEHDKPIIYNIGIGHNLEVVNLERHELFTGDEHEAHINGIVKAVNGTWQKGINPDAAEDLLKIAKLSLKHMEKLAMLDADAGLCAYGLLEAIKKAELDK